jgi:predicted RNase H-like HicB family nuclease
MKTYNFRIVVEPDGERWHAYCPALVGQGGATWGYTQQEALKNIHEVIQLVVESMMEQGEALPAEPADQVQVSGEPQAAVVV